jgi:hypothetical protein
VKGALVAVLLQLLLVSSWHGYEINPKTCGQIAIGMTKAEVRSVMRIPEGEYRLAGGASTAEERMLSLSGRGLLALKNCQQWWVSDFGAIGVDFNELGRVRSIRVTSIDTLTAIPEERRAQYNILRLVLCSEEAEK